MPPHCAPPRARSSSALERDRKPLFVMHSDFEKTGNFHIFRNNESHDIVTAF